MKQSNTYSDFIKELNAGHVCAFETDTVVGLGCKILDESKTNDNINSIYSIKSRSHTKALPWLISSKAMLEEWAVNIPDYAYELIDNEWPGATTLIFEVNDRLPEGLGVNTKNGLHTVAFRIPNCEELINAIDYIGCPVATTSANESGKEPPKILSKVKKGILNQVDFVYEKRQEPSGTPSKIISCINEEPKVIR